MIVPRISIVTPSFNQGPYIKEALLSVANQNDGSLEHLVIDGGSTDGTVDTLRQCTEERRWEHLHWISEADRGQSDALNKGFKLAQGEIIGWLNSDDRYRPGCFDYVSRVFAAEPDVDIVYGDYTWIDQGGEVFRVRREIEFSRFILLHHRVLYIPTTATFFRRRIFDDGNWLNLDLRYAMDFEFFVRLAQRGYKFRHVPKLLADFRWQPASKSCTALRGQLEETTNVARACSPYVSGFRSDLARKCTFQALRCTAAVLRYSEKLARGYYLEQYFPGRLVRSSPAS